MPIVESPKDRGNNGEIIAMNFLEFQVSDIKMIHKFKNIRLKLDFAILKARRQ